MDGVWEVRLYCVVNMWRYVMDNRCYEDFE